MSYETLAYEQDDHVVTLTYDRPEQHNAVSWKMNEELHHAWQRFRDDDDAFVLVVTGAGDTTFCAGWDLQDASELSELGDFDRYRRDLYNLPGACGYTRKVDIFKPVIAAVNGHAIADGCEILQATDEIESACSGVVMASNDAREGPRAFREKREPVFTGE